MKAQRTNWVMRVWLGAAVVAVCGLVVTSAPLPFGHSLRSQYFFPGNFTQFNQYVAWAVVRGCVRCWPRLLFVEVRTCVACAVQT